MIKLVCIILIGGILMGQNVKYIEIKDIKVPVVYLKSDKLPKLDIQVLFRNAGKTASDKAGLSYILSRVLSSGTKKENETEFYEELELNAISFSSYSGYETLGFNISSLKEESKKAINALGAVLKNPRFSKENLNTIKTKIKSRILSKQNDFDYMASVGLNKMLFKDNNLAKPIIGDMKSLKSISLSDIEEFFKKYINISNAIVVISGDYSDKDIKLISKALNILKKGKRTKQKSFKVKNSEKTIKEYAKTDQAYINFGSSFDIEVNSEDYYKAKVAHFILGMGGFGSRMMEEIRVKHGLAYSAYSHITVEKSFSSFGGALQTKIENEEKAISLVKEIIDKFVSKGVSSKELNDAKKFILGSYPLKNETLSQRVDQIFSDFYKSKEENSYKKDLDRIKNLTLKDLNDFIKKHKEIMKLSFYVVTSKDKE